VPISILQNTFTPDISAQFDRTILDCNHPNVTLKGQSVTNGVDYLWGFVGTPGTLQGDTITALADFTSTTKTLVNTYTLTVTNTLSTCKSTSVIPIYQDLFPPKAIISNGGVSAISCKTQTLMLTNQSTSSIPPSTFPVSSPVVASWEGPTPQVPLLNSTTYTAATVGVYTMTAKDLNNGCISQATVSVTDNLINKSRCMFILQVTARQLQG
jgi:hypothetical protein